MNVKVPELDAWKLLLVVGGAVFLFQFSEVAREARDMNRCVVIQNGAIKKTVKDESWAFALAVSKCNGNPYRQ